MAAAKGNKYAEGNNGGAPTKYKPEFCKQLIEFFDIEPYIDHEIPHYKDGDVAWTDFKRMAAKLPTLRNFAKSIDVDISTTYNWMNEKHESFQKEFLDAFTHAQDIRKWFLIENGLNGTHNAAYAKFVAINVTDMKDQSQLDLSNKGKPFDTVNITVREVTSTKKDESD